MQHSDFQLASEVLRPSGTDEGPAAKEAPTAGRKTRTRGALAGLLLDHQRYATTPEAVSFFRQTAAATGALPDASLSSSAGPGLRPDMFGHVAGGGEEKGPRVEATGGVPLLRRWRLARARASAQTTPFRWRRVDELIREEALARAAAAVADRAQPSHKAHAMGGRGPMRAFFSCTAAEYEEVGEAESPPRGWPFDHAASSKLLALYERFGSFPVVADRWAEWDRTGTAPCTDDGPPTDDPTPPVEALAEEYHRITSGVMKLRMQKLREAIPGGAADHGKGGTAPRKRTRARDDAPHHPLLSLLAGHPLLAAAPRVDEDGAPPPAPSKDSANGHANDAEEVGKDPAGAPTSSNRAWAQHHRQQFQRLITPAAWYDATRERHRRRALIRLLEHEAKINVPYNRAGASYLELLPRAAQVLLRVFAVLPNALPVEAAADAKDGASQPCPEPSAAADSSPPQRRLNAGDRNPLMMVRQVLGRLTKSGKPIMLTERRPNEATTEKYIKDSDVKTAVDLVKRMLKSLPGINPMAWRSTNESLAKISSAASVPSSGPSGASSTVLEVLEEAFEAIPIQCTRLLLCSQAGWLLPATASLLRLIKPTASDELKDSNPKNGNSNATNNNNNNNNNSSHNEEEKLTSHAGSPKNPSESFHAPYEVTPAEMSLLQRIHRYGVCNQAHSNLSEAVLLTLPPTIPRLHREVEQELEKYLWEDHSALMIDAPPVHKLTADIRVVYSQNIVLQRLLTRLENLDDTMTRLHGDAQLALQKVHGDRSSGEQKCRKRSRKEEGGDGEEIAASSD